MGKVLNGEVEAKFSEKKVRRVAFLVYASAVIALYFWNPAVSAPRRLIVFHTNDIHGRVSSAPSSGGGEWVGGFPVLAAFLAEQSRPYLLLDAGDFYQGTPEGNLTRGDAAVDGMNAVGYDAAAVGNHEFDDGVENLARLAGAAEFPLLCANVTDRRAPSRLAALRPWVLKEVDGVKVGVFGLISRRTSEMVFAKNVADLTFADEAAAARRAVEELRRQGADIVIALSHLGYEQADKPPAAEESAADDQTLALSVDGIDLIVGGHSHTPLFAGRRVGKTWVVQAGTGLRWIGRVILSWDGRTKKIVGVRSRLIPLDRDRWGEEPNVAALMRYYREAASRTLGRDLEEVVGTLQEPLKRNYRGESSSGDWHADVLRAFAGADVAFHNSGG
ncbi:MAG TPA: metallophosphoesterase, partial [Elusimicrobiota bacterium]|nr:metallophosphoesterase [Elusimicrobiota bacterium]